MCLSNNSRILCFGEMLWDILPGEKSPGGAPMNVAVHLNRLGMDVYLASRVGDDPLGHNLMKYLDEVNFTNYFLQVDSLHPTGTAEVEMSQTNEPQYHFPDCAWDYLELNQVLNSLAERCDILIYGSLVGRKPVSYNTLMRLIGQDNTYKVFDVNLRNPHYSKELIKQLLKQANLVKMNSSELRIIREWFLESSDEETLLRELRDRFHCQVISVTYGKEGASLLYEDNYLRHNGYSTQVINTIGAGDAFLAGLLYGILNGKEIGKILDFAVALGAFITTRSGATPFYKKEDVEDFKNTDL